MIVVEQWLAGPLDTLEPGMINLTCGSQEEASNGQYLSTEYIHTRSTAKRHKSA